VIAAVAKRAVERNALQGQIDVWSAKSDQLQVGVHIPRRAQVLVTETFSSGLLSEHVLPTVEDAFERLLEPDAVVIPRRAAAMGYLVGGRFLEDHFFSAAWDGLELSEFDFLAPAKLGMHLDRVPHAVLSDPFEIFGFDLADGRFPAERRPLLVEATSEGRCIGVAQWIRLELDAQSVYENRPTAEAGANGWMHVIYPFIRPVEVKPGDLVPLVAGHNRAEIVVGLNEAP
jgi:type II protein arginine methyltransferase